MYNADLKNVKVISKDIDKKLEKIETAIENLQKGHRLLLAINWKGFRPATLKDFNPKSIRKAKTKKEAEKEIPTESECKELAERGKKSATSLENVCKKVFKR